LRSSGLAGLALAAGLMSAHAADSVTASNQDGYSRLSFTFAPAAHVKAEITGGVFVLTFDRKVTLAPDTLRQLMGAAVTSVKTDADGKSFRFALSQPLKLHQSAVGDRAVVDLAPANFSGTMPDLAPPPPPPPKTVDATTLPELKVRTGSYANFTRLVFDWPRDVAYQVFPGAGKIAIRFDAPVRPDFSAITRFQPPWIKAATWRLDGTATIVELATDSDSGFHDFKDGTKIVLDILAPKTDATAYLPPGEAKPGITKMLPVTAAQVQAVAATAQAVAGPKVVPVPAARSDSKAADAKAAPAKPADTKTAGTKPAATDSKAVMPEAKPAPEKDAAADAPQPPAQSLVQETDSRITLDGVVLNFKHAGVSGSAVFIRGLTAWIVLENAPMFDVTQLKNALAGFAAGLEASSSPGLSILRIGLKQPEAITAQGIDGDLKVVIAPDARLSTIAIGFARNQDDPARASFTTLLPGADKVFSLTDPVAGDVLTVLPATAGRAMLAERDFAEFTALKTASGLVLMPLTDDLSVSVAAARVAISRPGGLSITPPQLPAAQTPAALAHNGDGPAYLDFAAWAPLTGGSFLATERKLRQTVAHLPPTQANHARLMLARFYLANHFAAEALGLLNTIQAVDPGLAGDTQIAVMRGAADYMAGRYRDAHNDLAATALDSDRHVAFWRGLIEAALENWPTAHADLELALPVMKRYPADWQTRAHLADAEAALGMGRLELADAALMRLPKSLSAADQVEEKLAKARIAALENRYRTAEPLFAAVENSGNEPLAAQAIFYQANAALNARAITPQQGIDILERLRFRWRGDGLEMKTLRKLASLYFQRGQWQEGLTTLKVATKNFEGNDAARAAQDDMRAAFVNLYLKGGADKLPPVESLSLFYDNIDLTPIGPDGDEMIRRMVDRLVAVDLLGPAAQLLAYQVDKRLDGVAKASVATKLAGLYLLDHKPQAALDILHGTQISGLPDDVGHQRLLIEARAFAGLRQWDNALDLLDVDEAADTRALRADIYWQSGNWAVAGQKLEELLDTRWSDAQALTATERGEVLRAAVAYSLADDETGLDRLRGHYGPKMAGTTDANAFAVLAQNIDMHGASFRDAAAKIASVDLLTSFMKDFSKVAIN
jgi:hypothetical protein